MTVSEFLDRLSLFGRRDALVQGDETCSYHELLLAMEERREMRSVPPFSVVALVGGFDVRTISAMLALWERDCVVVPMLSLNEERLGISQAEYMYEHGRIRSTGNRADHSLYRELRGPGLVLFTSGSAGEPKAVLHGMTAWMKKLDRKGRAQRTLAFLSFDHVGGLNTLLYALANGGSVVVPEDRSPATVWEAIRRHEVELLPATPTFLRLALLDGGIPPLPTLRMIAYGSEPMPEATLNAVRASLPSVEFLQQYGMSELGVLRSRSRGDGSNWVRLGGPEFGVRVVDGLLEIRAETAMRGYLNAPSPFTEDGWLRTGDEAETDGEWLRVRGRRSETINVGGEKVHPTEVRRHLEALDGVLAAEVRGEPHPLVGHVVVAAVALKSGESADAFRTRIRTELKGVLPRYAIPQRIEPLNLGMTERGKSQRAVAALPEEKLAA